VIPLFAILALMFYLRMNLPVMGEFISGTVIFEFWFLQILDWVLVISQAAFCLFILIKQRRSNNE
jgi:hypothetical protein